MKPLAHIVGCAIGLMTLLSLQLCLLKYEHTTNCNLLLVAYLYALLAPLSNSITTVLILMLDGMNFLITGYFGYMTIMLTLMSFAINGIKDNFYHKLVMPIAGIAGYYLFELIMHKVCLLYSLSVSEFLGALIINSILFTSLWWVTNQPMHD